MNLKSNWSSGDVVGVCLLSQEQALATVLKNANDGSVVFQNVARIAAGEINTPDGRQKTLQLQPLCPYALEEKVEVWQVAFSFDPVPELRDLYAHYVKLRNTLRVAESALLHEKKPTEEAPKKKKSPKTSR